MKLACMDPVESPCGQERNNNDENDDEAVFRKRWLRNYEEEDASMIHDINSQQQSIWQSVFSAH